MAAKVSCSLPTPVVVNLRLPCSFFRTHRADLGFETRMGLRLAPHFAFAGANWLLWRPQGELLVLGQDSAFPPTAKASDTSGAGPSRLPGATPSPYHIPSGDTPAAFSNPGSAQAGRTSAALPAEAATARFGPAADYQSPFRTLSIQLPLEGDLVALTACCFKVQHLCLAGLVHHEEQLTLRLWLVKFVDQQLQTKLLTTLPLPWSWHGGAAAALAFSSTALSVHVALFPAHHAAAQSDDGATGTAPQDPTQAPSAAGDRAPALALASSALDPESESWSLQEPVRPLRQAKELADHGCVPVFHTAVTGNPQLVALSRSGELFLDLTGGELGTSPIASADTSARSLVQYVDLGMVSLDVGANSKNSPPLPKLARRITPRKSNSPSAHVLAWAAGPLYTSILALLGEDGRLQVAVMAPSNIISASNLATELVRTALDGRPTWPLGASLRLSDSYAVTAMAALKELTGMCAPVDWGAFGRSTQWQSLVGGLLRLRLADSGRRWLGLWLHLAVCYQVLQPLLSHLPVQAPWPILAGPTWPPASLPSSDGRNIQAVLRWANLGSIELPKAVITGASFVAHRAWVLVEQVILLLSQVKEADSPTGTLDDAPFLVRC